MGTMIDIPYGGSTIQAYLAVPEGDAPHPGLVVVQEWWGLNQQIRDTADRLAAEGYLALAPDLYDGNVTEEVPDAERFIRQFSDKAPHKTIAAYDALRARSDVQKTGALGWCMGGRMALHLAINQPQLDACVSFYGRLDAYLGKLSAIRCPVLGLFGETDESIPLPSVEQFDRELDEANVTHEIVVYPGAGHAFFNERREHRYHPEAAQDAWQRTLTFFAKYLS